MERKILEGISKGNVNSEIMNIFSFHLNFVFRFVLFLHQVLFKSYEKKTPYVLVLSTFWNPTHMSLPVEAYPSSPVAEVTASSVQCPYLTCISIATLPSLHHILYTSSPQLQTPCVCSYCSIQPLLQYVAHIRHSTIVAKWKNGKRQSSETVEPGLKVRTSHS